MRKYLMALVVALGLLLVSPVAAQAADYLGPGPYDLSGGLNSGEHVEVGGLSIGSGEWTVTAGVLLSVGDPNNGKPAAEQKNSQGCGLYLDDTQVGGSGGSSSGWTATSDGKTKQMTLITHPWSSDPSYDPTIVVDGPGILTLKCFIDASHSGVTEGDREFMSASDARISAQLTPGTEPCEWDAELTADDPECVEPEPDPATSDKTCDDFSSRDEVTNHLEQYPGDFDRLDGDDDGVPCELVGQNPDPEPEPDPTMSEEPEPTTEPEPKETETTTPVASTSSGKGELPETGAGLVALLAGSLGLLTAGAGMLWWKRCVQ